MVPLDPASLATFFGIGLATIFVGAALYGTPGKPVKERIEDASKLILRLLSCPLEILGITIVFAAIYVESIARYLVRRVGNRPIPAFRLKASFDE